MKIEHMVLCKDSIIDRERNTLSVFEFIEEISIKSGNKSATIPFHLLAVFRREKEIGEKNMECELTIFNPTGKEIGKIKLPARIESNHRRFRLRINGTFPVDSSGDYVFKVTGPEIAAAEAILGVNFEWIEGASPSKE